MRIRDRIGISRARQEQLSRLLQLSLVGFFFVGLYELNLGIAINSLVGIGVTLLPAVLERDYQIPMDAGLTLWMTVAVFLHTFGTVGLPGMEQSVYQSIGWWDHLTHALSASLVGAAGYATVRAIEEHTDGLYFPPKFTFVLLLVFVLAFGVLWEVLEFAIGGLSQFIDMKTGLIQHGVRDTMLDLIFDAIGAIVVAIWGTAHLTGITDAIVDRLESMSERSSSQ